MIEFSDLEVVKLPTVKCKRGKWKLETTDYRFLNKDAVHILLQVISKVLENSNSFEYDFEFDVETYSKDDLALTAKICMAFGFTGTLSNGDYFASKIFDKVQCLSDDKTRILRVTPNSLFKNAVFELYHSEFSMDLPLQIDFFEIALFACKEFMGE